VGIEASACAHKLRLRLRLDNSRTGQVVDWTTRGCHGRLCVLSFRSFGGICETTSCPVRELAIRELAYPRGPPVKCGFADLRIFKRVKCRWFCRFFLRMWRVKCGCGHNIISWRKTLHFVEIFLGMVFYICQTQN